MALGRSIKMYLSIFIATTCIYMVLYQYHVPRQPLPSPELLKNKEILDITPSETEKQSGTNNILTSKAGDLVRRYNLFLWSPMSMLSTLQQQEQPQSQPQQQKQQKREQEQQNEDLQKIHGAEISFYESSNTTSKQNPHQPQQPQSFLSSSSSSLASPSLLPSPLPSVSSLSSSSSSSSSLSLSSSSAASISFLPASILTQSKSLKHSNNKTSDSSNKVDTPYSAHHDHIHAHRSGQQYSMSGMQRRHHDDHNNNITNDEILPLGNANNNNATGTERGTETETEREMEMETAMATIPTTTVRTTKTRITTTTKKEMPAKSRKFFEYSSISTNSSTYFIHSNTKISTTAATTPIPAALVTKRIATTMTASATTKNSSNSNLKSKSKLKQKFLAESSPPPLYIITPTYRRPEQLAELTRLGYTLKHVQNLLWLVIEDANSTSSLVKQTLDRIGVPYEYFVAPMPEEYKKTKKAKPRGVSNRNRGLQWLRENATEGVFYFADDDNTYDIAIFEQMRYTQRISMWPVGLVTKFGVSSPIVRNGKFDGFYDGWVGGRKYAVDMAGFAVSVKFLHDRPAAKMPFKPGYEEDGFLKSLAPFNNNEIELLASKCTQILTWHTQTKKNPPAERLNITKYGHTNIETIDKLLVRP